MVHGLSDKDREKEKVKGAQCGELIGTGRDQIIKALKVREGSVRATTE